MSKKKVAGIIVACIIGIIVVIAAATPSQTPRATERAPEVSVHYEVTVDLGSAWLSVRVEGPQKSYNILLFDPQGERVGYGFISSDDMTLGRKTERVSMTDIGVMNPVPGEYYLLVKEFITDKSVFEAKPVFDGADVSITAVEFKTDYGYFGGSIDEVTVEVYNGGDLPIFVDQLRLLIAGDEEDITVWSEPIPHGETTVIEGFVWIWELEQGTHPATIELYSEGVRLASYETEVEIG